MALQGSLDTFALPDVLRLLASTAKSGRLDVVGDRSAGHLWFTGGQVVAAKAELNDEVPDVVFELLRSQQGDFVFNADEVADEPGAPQAVDLVIATAEQLLETWREIEAVVPHLGCHVRLADELAADEVTIDRTRWGHLVAIGEGRSVAALGAALGLGEFKVSQLVKELVDDGLVEVGEAPAGGDVPADDWSAGVVLGDEGPAGDVHELVPGGATRDLDAVVRAELDEDGQAVDASREVALDATLLDTPVAHAYLAEGDGAGLPEALPEALPDGLVDPGGNPFGHA